MAKRSNREIRKAIFEVLSDKKTHSYANLERKVNTNWFVIHKHSVTWNLLIHEEGSVRNSFKVVKAKKITSTEKDRLKMFF